MKNPLRYQISEYDCGPTSVLNAISFLFEREEVLPDLIRNIMLYSLDCYGRGGCFGTNGTSRMAMMFLSRYMEGAGEAGVLPVSSEYLSGEAVYIAERSPLVNALRQKGVAVVRLFLEGEHYVLLTGVKGDNIYLFDPYYLPEGIKKEGIVSTLDYPMAYNRIVPFYFFNKISDTVYALGKEAEREAVIFYDRRTRLTSENTIEYFI